MQRTSGGLFILLIAALLLTGCVTPTVTTNSDTELSRYRKVYLLPLPKDPREVYPRIAARLKKSGFEVVEGKKDEPLFSSQGTGFIVTPQGHLLTCAHVLGTRTNGTIWIQGTRYDCRVIATDTNIDLAVMLVEGSHPAFQPLKFSAATNIMMGQDAFTMGFPLVEVLGTAPRLNKGLISATVGMDDNPKQVQVSAQVQPGNSGGPLLDEHGEVLGVMVATLNPMKVLATTGGGLPQNVNFAIAGRYAREFLKSANVEVSDAVASVAKANFEQAKQSLALVRGGHVTEDELKMPALICGFGYYSIWDMYFRFQALELQFFDFKKGEEVLKAGWYRDDPFVSEDGALDRVFGQIHSKFFPDQPNPFPFKGKKK